MGTFQEFGHRGRGLGAVARRRSTSPKGSAGDSRVQECDYVQCQEEHRYDRPTIGKGGSSKSEWMDNSRGRSWPLDHRDIELFGSTVQTRGQRSQVLQRLESRLFGCYGCRRGSGEEYYVSPAELCDYGGIGIGTERLHEAVSSYYCYQRRGECWDV